MTECGSSSNAIKTDCSNLAILAPAHRSARPYDADEMTAWKVDKAVGNVKNDRPESIRPSSAAPEQAEEPL